MAPEDRETGARERVDRRISPARRDPRPATDEFALDLLVGAVQTRADQLWIYKLRRSVTSPWITTARW